MKAPKRVSPAAGPGKPINGLRGLELLRSLGKLRDNPPDFLLKLALRFGGVTDLPFPFERVILISNPEYIEYILHRNYANYLKDTGRWHSFREILGNGLLTADGQDWRRQRQRVQPAFHQDRMPLLERAIEQETAILAEAWRRHARTSEPVPVLHDMLGLMLKILTRVMFSRDVGDVIDPVLAAFKTAHTFLNPFSVANLLDPPRFLRHLISPGYGKFARSLRVLDDVVHRIIRDRVASGVDTGDMLSMLVSSRDEEANELMNSTQVRDEVMTAFMAGHETTAIALTWTLYLLARHPTIEQQVWEELRSALAVGPVTLADLPKIDYLRCTIEEGMRLYPPGWGLDRRAAEDDDIDGYRIPANATVAFSAYVVQHHPDYWPDAETFDPLRFTDERSKDRPLYAYFPFGGGPRRCIGHRVAMVQMQAALARLLREFKLELVSDEPVAPKAVLNLMPRREIFMKVTPRPT